MTNIMAFPPASERAIFCSDIIWLFLFMFWVPLFLMSHNSSSRRLPFKRAASFAVVIGLQLSQNANFVFSWVATSLRIFWYYFDTIWIFPFLHINPSLPRGLPSNNLYCWSQLVPKLRPPGLALSFSLFFSHLWMFVRFMTFADLALGCNFVAWSRCKTKLLLWQ